MSQIFNEVLNWVCLKVSAVVFITNITQPSKMFIQEIKNLEIETFYHKIKIVFEIFEKNKRKLMCYTYSNSLIFEVFDDNLAVTDEK